MKSESYKISDCCGADCNFENNSSDEPCWGEVEVVGEEYNDEDYWWIHACQGHLYIDWGEKYKRENHE
jgi:hypothetical protein